MFDLQCANQSTVISQQNSSLQHSGCYCFMILLSYDCMLAVRVTARLQTFYNNKAIKQQQTTKLKRSNECEIEFHPKQIANRQNIY